jgi:putative colanic acid biosynthesis UDP-glucose lipid carrier transferase
MSAVHPRSGKASLKSDFPRIAGALPAAGVLPATPVHFRRASSMSVGRTQLLALIEITLEPLILVLSLLAVALLTERHLGAHHMILAIIVFALTFPGPARLTKNVWRALRDILMGWLTLSGLLFFFGYASRYLDHFDRELLITWWWAAPCALAAAHLVLRFSAPAIREFQGGPRRAVIAGMNDPGIELARRLKSDVYSNVNIVGFVDDRERGRVKDASEHAVLGTIRDLPDLVKRKHIDLVYLSLPMASQSRILSLLDEMRDTTASVYFVPDMFVTDLIQGRIDSVSGLPVVGVCDTPFYGMSGLLKRSSDVVLSLIILTLISPLLLVLAIAVKISSPGPVIFKQRRYGLAGDEIVVYKFRTMTVMDDGDVVKQATENDQRLTPLGAFMRRNSLDELPQFFNVLQGRMSIVGPRPHAVAHNEMYRKLIKGYMQRHKVKPGITGWAQVNGYRGETRTLERMKARIEYDLDYLRNWSLRLDLFIVAKTIWVVLRRSNAY